MHKTLYAVIVTEDILSYLRIGKSVRPFKFKIKLGIWIKQSDICSTPEAERPRMLKTNTNNVVTNYFKVMWNNSALKWDPNRNIRLPSGHQMPHVNASLVI